jgi:hypothetical protein
MRRLLLYIVYILLAPGLVPAQQTSTLWHDQQRSIRYKPVGNDFVIVGGGRRFNRALYGTHTAFRAEAGDLPEFALYMPGMGGNWRFELLQGEHRQWLTKSKIIRAAYRPGSMLYEIRDPLLGKGVLHVTVLALADAEGMIIRVAAAGVDPRIRLQAVFGGASGKKFPRDGDIGADPESSFDCKPEYCRGNRYSIDKNTFHLAYAESGQLEGVFPSDAKLSVVDSMLKGSLSLAADSVLYFLVRKPSSAPAPVYSDLPALFDQAEAARRELAGRVQVNTPDPYINTLGGALSVAADAIWEDPSYLHGAVAWRMRLNAWRGPYVADPLGWHDRARLHFSSYALSQIATPASGPVIADTALHLARQLERLGTSLFSSGYISRNPLAGLPASLPVGLLAPLWLGRPSGFRPHHYDMNLVFIDQLLDHFYWTGDTAFVRKMWPVIQRHLAWEKRNFDSDGDGLYDAYCCIWASDALEYSGGGVTHSSAYNYRANKITGDLATLIGEDPAPYRREAEKILHAINTKLWMPDKGWYAEYIDRADAVSAGPDPADAVSAVGVAPIIHPAAGLWTIYHAIDSRVPDAFQAWQSLRYIDTDIPHIPIRARGLEDTSLYTLSTTNWQPYTWSVNNVAMAESLHTALAYWQGGRAEEAWPLWKGALVESMYLGASPGNFQQLSFYDAMRGELYRDFADPIGMAARSLVEGLFGIRPDALHDTLTIQPGWPADWSHASLHIPDINIDYMRTGPEDRYVLNPAFAVKMNLKLRVRARTTAVRSVSVNGRPVEWTAVEEAVGLPLLQLLAPPAASYDIRVEWKDVAAPASASVLPVYSTGTMMKVSYGRGVTILDVYDPQQVLDHPVRTAETLQGSVMSGGRREPVMREGNKTVFVRLQQGDFRWWNPLCLHVVQPVPDLLVARRETDRYDTVSLSSFFNDRVTQIFRNQYLSPRPAVPTLQLPTQGIGNWCYPLVTADIDDAGLRAAAGGKNEIFLPGGVPLATPGISAVASATNPNAGRNIIFTSRWDNYPDSVIIPLKGVALHAYFMLAGSTNPMQSRIVNGVIDVRYKDGSVSELPLINPSTWWPVEQDYYEDGYAFTTGAPRPWRVYLKTGKISRDKPVWTSIKGFSNTVIDGGAATILDLPLIPGRELDRVVVRAVARDVVIGLMSMTLMRN